LAIPAPIGVAAAGKPNAGDQANAVITGVFTSVGPGKAFAFRGPMNIAIWGSINVSLATTNGSSSATVGSAAGLAVGDAINSVNVPPGTTIGALVSTTATLAFPTQTYQGIISPTGQLTINGIASAAGLLGAIVTPSANNEGVTLPTGTFVASIIQTPIAPNTPSNSPGRPAILQLSAVPTVLPITSGPIPFDFVLTNNSVVTGTDNNAIFTGATVSYSGTINVEYSFDGGATWLVGNVGGSGTLAQYSTGTPVRLAFGEPERQVLYRLNCVAYTPVSNLTLNYRISATGAAAESLAIGAVI
jgi:hypothetical protein